MGETGEAEAWFDGWRDLCPVVAASSGLVFSLPRHGVTPCPTLQFLSASCTWLTPARWYLNLTHIGLSVILMISYVELFFPFLL